MRAKMLRKVQARINRNEAIWRKEGEYYQTGIKLDQSLTTGSDYFPTEFK